MGQCGKVFFIHWCSFVTNYMKLTFVRLLQIQTNAQTSWKFAGAYNYMRNVFIFRIYIRLYHCDNTWRSSGKHMVLSLWCNYLLRLEPRMELFHMSCV